MVRHQNRLTVIPLEEQGCTTGGVIGRGSSRCTLLDLPWRLQPLLCFKSAETPEALPQELTTEV